MTQPDREISNDNLDAEIQFPPHLKPIARGAIEQEVFDNTRELSVENDKKDRSELIGGFCMVLFFFSLSFCAGFFVTKVATGSLAEHLWSFAIILLGPVIIYLVAIRNNKRKNLVTKKIADLVRRQGSLEPMEKSHCQQLLSWCENYGEVRGFQMQVVALARNFTAGEFRAIERWVSLKENQQAVEKQEVACRALYQTPKVTGALS